MEQGSSYILIRTNNWIADARQSMHCRNINDCGWLTSQMGKTEGIVGSFPGTGEQKNQTWNSGPSLHYVSYKFSQKQRQTESGKAGIHRMNMLHSTKQQVPKKRHGLQCSVQFPTLSHSRVPAHGPCWGPFLDRRFTALSRGTLIVGHCMHGKMSYLVAQRLQVVERGRKARRKVKDLG